MIKRYKTTRNWYLMSMVLFIGFSFEFFIRSDNFLGGILIFNGVVNLLAFQQVPRKISTVTIFLNLFNTLMSIITCYNYSVVDYSILYVVWMLIALGYFSATLRQVLNLTGSAHFKRRMRHRND